MFMSYHSFSLQRPSIYYRFNLLALPYNIFTTSFNVERKSIKSDLNAYSNEKIMNSSSSLYASSYVARE